MTSQSKSHLRVFHIDFNKESLMFPLIVARRNTPAKGSGSMSPGLMKTWSFILMNLNSHYPRLFSNKFEWNSRSAENLYFYFLFFFWNTYFYFTLLLLYSLVEEYCRSFVQIRPLPPQLPAKWSIVTSLVDTGQVAVDNPK
jgi:hypothetical protein